MRWWDGSVAEISAFPTELKIFPHEHSIPVTATKRFNKIASLPQQSGQNCIILSSMYFYFRSKRFLFGSKVTRR